MPDATIYDVAEKAAVSIATVSRVLNSPTRVNATTRARVLAAIDELGFMPKAEATARARRGSGRIGVLAPFFTLPSFVERLRGVAKALAGLSYELVIYNVDSSARRDGYLASLPIGRRLDGLIVMALPFDSTVARRLVDNQLQTVLLEYTDPSFSSIEIDDQSGGRLAGEYLAERGYRRCAFVGDVDVPSYAIHTSAHRLRGYRHALNQFGIGLPEQYVALAPHGMEYAQQQGHRLLDLAEPPDAIFAPSDTQAMGVLMAARERSIAVPSQLAVIGFDDVETARYIGLTTIHQPLEESGRIAVDLLLGRIAEHTRPVQHIRLPLRVIRRETA